MIERIEQLDKNLFLALNGQYSDFSDRFWQIVTETNTWIPLYALLLFGLLIHFKKDGLWVVVMVALVIVSSDLFTSAFMKPFFGRLRPCYDESIGHLVHVVSGCGGRYGFASGHSANSFGLATVIWLLLHRRWRWTVLLFFWSAMVAYSRIMVGVHYPVDILVGAAVGVFFGWFWFNAIRFSYFRLRRHPLLRD